MDKVKAGEKRARYLEIEQLYRDGFTLRQIGAQLEPPLTPQWTGQLLRQGAKLGLYLMPTIHRDRERANERRLSDLEVRAVLLTTQRREQAAKVLGITKAALDSRFGHVIRGVADERKRLTRRKTIVAEYREMARRLGYNPSAADMPHALVTRIQRLYGSVRRFYAEQGVEPRDRRKR